MRIALIIVIAVAVIFAGGVFYFLTTWMEGVEEDARLRADAEKPGIEAVEILVADIDLPAGTVIASEHIDWQPWPDDSLDSDYIVYREDDPDDDKDDLEDPVYDMVVRRAIMAGEPLTLPKLFLREEATFLAGMLTPGMRAVSIKVPSKSAAGVAGFIMPGDYVDVIVTIKWKVDKEVREAGLPFTEYTSETVVQNARVMGIDQSYGDLEENAVVADFVTIEVTPKQAEVITVASNAGDLSLTLRSLQPGDTGAFAGFTSDRESLYAMGGSFPTTERLAQPIAVAETASGAATGEDGGLPESIRFRAVTARHDLLAGTLLRASDIAWLPLPGDVASEQYVVQGREHVNLKSLSGILLTADVKAGEPLPLAALLSSSSSEFMAAALRPGMRAASLRDLGSFFAGTPGDQVDVVLVGQVEGHRFSETILQRARVLIADSGGSRSATIEVSPKQFETLAVAQTVGAIMLSLRSANTTVADIYGGQFTSDLEISRALSGGLEALIASGEARPSEEDMIVVAPTLRTNVLVAVRDLDAGTMLRDSDFRFEVLEGAMPEDANYFARENTNVLALRGALVTQAIAADEVLSADKLIKPGTQGFLSAALSPGMRGVSIAINPVSGISGFISPGDHVDVLMTHELQDIGDNPVLRTRVYTETILRNLRVLAIEQTIDKSSGKPVIGQTVTMEVEPKQAETLALGARMGDLSLVLHGAIAEAEVEPQEPPFTSDIEISHATTTFIYGTEAIYAPPAPESTPPSTDAGAPSITTVAPTVRSTGDGTVKVYRSTTSTTESFSN